MGVIIIVAIVLVAALGGLAFHLVVHKGYLRNRGTNPPGETHRPGRL